MIARAGVLYHPQRDDAKATAELAARLLTQRRVAVSMLPAWDDEAVRAGMQDWQLCITCGGDGTILRTSRLAAPFGVPQIGINHGRLGFLAELQPDEVADRLPLYLDGEPSVEVRAMLRATPVPRVPGETDSDLDSPRHFDALNEVLVARGVLPRVVRVKVSIDDTPFTDIAGDGVLVATATGSTAYSLAAGGPVLSPSLPNLLLNTVCPHVARMYPVVLPPEARVRLEVMGGFPAILSVDGQIDFALGSGDAVEIALSPFVARFLRVRPPTHFYQLIGRVLR